MQPREKHPEIAHNSTKTTLAHPPAVAVELEARERREREEQERSPTTAKELVEATLGAADKGAINELQIQYARNEQVQQILQQLEQRLTRFLVNTSENKHTTPSLYAQTVHAVAAAEHPNPQQLRVLQEFQHYFTAELNPLLYQLYETLHAIPGTTVTSHEALWEALCTGEVNNQKTTSLFGILRKIETHIPDSTLTLEKAEPIQKIVVVNPVDTRYTAYWNTRLNCQEIYGESSIPELVALRTALAQYELQSAADQLNDTPERQEVTQAYTTLIQWLEEQAEPFQSPDAKQPEQFGFLVRRLHFAQGSIEDTTDILNAAEIVKRTRPELYARLCGIAPRYDHGVSGDTEAGKSDLFGNAFQLALSRSLALHIRADATTHTLFHQRIEGLTEISRPQQLIQHMNAEQLAQLEQNIHQLQADAKKGGRTERTTSAVLALMASRYYFEAKLPHMLEAIRAQEFDEEREWLTERLRVAAPNECIALLKNMNHELAEHPEIAGIINDRVFSRARREVYLTGVGPHITGQESLPELGWHTYRYKTEQGHYKTHRREITNSFQLLNSLRNEEKEMKEGSTWNELVRCLWETTPDHTVLTEEFFDYLKSVFDSEFPTGSKKTILSILDAHPSITENEWFDWRDEMNRVQKKKRYFTERSRSDDSIYIFLSRFANELNLSNIVNTDTKFFRLLAMNLAIKKQPGEQQIHNTGWELLYEYKVGSKFDNSMDISHYYGIQRSLERVPEKERGDFLCELLQRMSIHFGYKNTKNLSYDGRILLLNTAELYAKDDERIRKLLDAFENKAKKDASYFEHTIINNPLCFRDSLPLYANEQPITVPVSRTNDIFGIRLTRKNNQWYREFFDQTQQRWLMNATDLENHSPNTAEEANALPICCVFQ